MKEGVGVMEEKEFVCHFCVSACLLAIRKEVRGLKEELSSVKCELKEVREENGRLKSQIEQERSERLRVAQEEMMGGTARCERVGGDKVVGSMAPVEDEEKTNCQQKATTGGEGSVRQKCIKVDNQKNSAWKEPKRIGKWVSGVRKVWGTQKKESCDEVAKEIIRTVGKMASRFSVGKQMGQLKGKNGWWFVVKAQEKNLLDLDEKWKHKQWQWQKVRRGGNDFLGVGPVSSGHR